MDNVKIVYVNILMVDVCPAIMINLDAENVDQIFFLILICIVVIMYFIFFSFYEFYLFMNFIVLLEMS